MRTSVLSARVGACLILVSIATIASEIEGVPAGASAEVVGGRVDEYLRPLVLDGHVSGVLLIARGGEVLYEKAFGKASYELDVPIKRWLPDFPASDRITVRQLLGHRAGIPHRVTTEFEETVAHDAADMVRIAARKPLLFEPGTKEFYSSAGYSVLARVLELASGQSYSELLQQYLFAAAGMKSSTAIQTARPIGNLAPSYYPDLIGVRRAALKDQATCSSARAARREAELCTIQRPTIRQAGEMP